MLTLGSEFSILNVGKGFGGNVGDVDGVEPERGVVGAEYDFSLASSSSNSAPRDPITFGRRWLEPKGSEFDKRPVGMGVDFEGVEMSFDGLFSFGG